MQCRTTSTSPSRESVSNFSLRPAAFAEQLQAPGDLEQSVAERDQAARLRGSLDKLPGAQREVIALAYFGEMSTSEIARELTLPLGTVKVACASA